MPQSGRAAEMTVTAQSCSGAKTHQPLVSVIIPAFKVADFIAETLASVTAQTYKNYEIIVINDGSPDTEELERNMSRFANQVTYLKQANGGAGAARNAGLRVARGEFVAFLDGDDLWLPDFLEQQMRLIQSDGGFELVYADAVNFEGSVRSRTTNMDTNPSDGPVTTEALISGRCNIITSSVVARLEPIIKVGLFDEGFPNSQDFDLWLRLAKEGAQMTYQKIVLVERRIYEGSLASDPIKSFTGEIKVLEKTARRTDLSAGERSALERKLALRHASVEVCRGKQRLSAGDFSSALVAFRGANNFYQSRKLRMVVLWLRLAPRSLQRFYKLRAT
jgi:glycosyltransferase involved in cell wall biosynthesis